jgi:hypothetical protein
MLNLDIPQDRIAKRVGMTQKSITMHLQLITTLQKIVNTDLKSGLGMDGPARSRRSLLPISSIIFQSKITWCSIPWPVAVSHLTHALPLTANTGLLTWWIGRTQDLK